MDDVFSLISSMMNATGLVCPDARISGSSESRDVDVAVCSCQHACLQILERRTSAARTSIISMAS